jgi:hypothetical protein
MNRVFDYNGTIVAPSNPVKRLKTVKKTLLIDSGDRDTAKYTSSGDFVVYLPRVYENVVSLRLKSAELPASPTTGGTPLYYILDIEGLNKSDECSVGADRSGYPDGFFAKIPVTTAAGALVLYNDHSAPENIAHYTPAIGKLDRLHLRLRTHSQKSVGGNVSWIRDTEYSLTFEIEMLDNTFDDFSSFESRITDRA